MSVHQHSSTPAGPTNGDAVGPRGRAARGDGGALRATASCSSPRRTAGCPSTGCTALDAMRLIGEELVLDGIPQRNLATFVTTWMEPEAQRIIAENLHRNFIDHAEYPQTAEIEQRCIRMLASLFHAPGETTGARTQGSSEAIMLGALSLKWNWRERREAGRQGHERGRTSSSAATSTSCGRSSAATSTSSRGSSRSSPTSTRSGPRTSSPTSTRTRSASRPWSARRSPATPTTSAASTTCSSACKHEQGHRRPAARRRRQRRLRVAVPVPGLRVGLPARAGALDQRLRAQVRARLPRHRLADLPRARATSPRISSSTRTTSASATRRSR